MLLFDDWLHLAFVSDCYTGSISKVALYGYCCDRLAKEVMAEELKKSVNIPLPVTLSCLKAKTPEPVTGNAPYRMFWHSTFRQDQP